MATSIVYKFDDGTGSLEVKQWVDSDAPAESKPHVAENQYGRVWGKLRSYNNRRHVIAVLVRPIEDFNEIPYHFLEATYVHLHFTRGPATEAGKTAGGQGQLQAGMGGGSQDTGLDAELRGLSLTARKVHKVLKDTPQNNEGLHMQDIASRLGIDTVEVGKAGDELLSTGLIYTTVDDWTWNLLGL